MRNQVPEKRGTLVNVLLSVGQEDSDGKSCAAIMSEQKPTNLDNYPAFKPSDSILRERTEKVSRCQILMKRPCAFTQLHRQKPMTTVFALLGDSGHKVCP